MSCPQVLAVGREGLLQPGAHGPAPVLLPGTVLACHHCSLQAVTRGRGREQQDTCNGLFAAFKHFRSLLFPLFPALHRVIVTQLLALVSNSKEPSLHPLYLVWSRQCHAACTYLFLRTRSLSLPAARCKSCEERVALLVCSCVSRSRAQSKAGFQCEHLCVCSGCVGLLGATPGCDLAQEGSTWGTAGQAALVIPPWKGRAFLGFSGLHFGVSCLCWSTNFSGNY